MNLPNVLTTFRALAVLPILVLFYVTAPWADWASAVVFALACMTDFLDGWLARSRGQITEFGRMLDPIADKMLVLPVLALLIADGEVYGFMLVPAVAIMLREVFVAGLREHLAGLPERVIVPVTFLAKCKTSLQMVATLVLLVGVFDPLQDGINRPIADFGALLLWGSAVVTIVTGVGYTIEGMRAMHRATAAKDVSGPRA